MSAILWAYIQWCSVSVVMNDSQNSIDIFFSKVGCLKYVLYLIYLSKFD